LIFGVKTLRCQFVGYRRFGRIFCYKFQSINPLTPELNPSAQRCLPSFLLGILIFKGLTARRLYKSFGVKGLNEAEASRLLRNVYKDSRNL
jgi:hypothetical protein